MSMSVNARATAYFKTSQQATEAAVISIAYILIGGSPAAIIDCFTTRSAALWIASFFETEALLVGLLILSAAYPQRRQTVVVGILELKCAQQLILARPAAEAALAMMVIFLFFNRHIGGVATCGISILATNQLEQWIADWGGGEAACVYMGAFCILHWASEASEGHLTLIVPHNAEDFMP
jgi:hypothetical protein